MNGSKQTATQVVGVDIAKRVFQLHWIDVETGEIMSVQLKREKLLEHFANRAGCLIGMEACGGAQHWARVGQLDEQVAEIERRLRAWHKEDKASRRIAEIPGVGLLTATAAVAAMGDPKSFKSAREFAAWLGLVPKHTGTGGRIRMLGISKRGDTYLRTLLIHGARSVIVNSKQPGAWVTNLTQRRAANVAVVALANKMARTIWALLAHERAFQKGYVSQPA